jgi:hypothetical protein
MKEKITVEGVEGDCFLVGFSHASDKDREDGKFDPCIPLVEMPKYKKPQLVSVDRLKTFVVVDVWAIEGKQIVKMRASLQAVLGLCKGLYYLSEHNARLTRDTQTHTIPLYSLMEKNAFVMNDKLYLKGSSGWIIHKRGNQNMWISSSDPGKLRDLLNLCRYPYAHSDEYPADDFELTITYKGCLIDG